jgi:hypothetical protein
MRTIGSKSAPQAYKQKHSRNCEEQQVGPRKIAREREPDEYKEKRHERRNGEQ